jgi:hypothetical protein
MPVLAVRVPVTQLSEWLAVRKKLAEVPQIKKVDVNSLGVDGASVMLSYVGTEQQLQASLAQADLVLSNDGGFWILRARLGTMPGFAPPSPNGPPNGPANSPANSPMSNNAPPGNVPPGNAPSGTMPSGNPSPAGQPGNMPTAGGPAGVPPLGSPAPVYVGPAPGTGGAMGRPAAPAFTAPGNAPAMGAPPANGSPGSILTR